MLNRNALDDIVVDVYHLVILAAHRTHMQGLLECTHVVQLVCLIYLTLTYCSLFKILPIAHSLFLQQIYSLQEWRTNIYPC